MLASFEQALRLDGRRDRLCHDLFSKISSKTNNRSYQVQDSANTVANFVVTLIACQFLNVTQTVLSAAFSQRSLDILTTFSIDSGQYVILSFSCSYKAQ